MPSERIEFPGAHGHALAARLDHPRGAARAYALFAHCFTCTKDIAAASRIARALCDHGIAVLRFDFTGLGGSDGDFANTNFSSNVADLIAAAAWLRAERAAPAFLIGHSLGGAAMIAAAPSVPEAKAVATIGAPADPGHVTHLFHTRLEEIEAQGEAEVDLAGRPFKIQQQFIEDVRGQRLEGVLKGLGKALLVFHSPIDQTVGIENAGQIYSAAKHPKSFVSLDTADHLLSKPADARYVAGVLAAWASRYVEAEGVAHPSPVEGAVVVRETGRGKFQQALRIGPHELVADEPLSVGGDDTGPTPYDLLLAGLGACTSMTMRMYAERKGWPLERATVTLSHDKIHAKDCETCKSESGRLDRVKRHIVLEGPLDEEQRRRVLEIADKCPVHRTLHGEVLVETSS